MLKIVSSDEQKQDKGQITLKIVSVPAQTTYGLEPQGSAVVFPEDSSIERPCCFSRVFLFILLFLLIIFNFSFLGFLRTRFRGKLYGLYVLIDNLFLSSNYELLHY